MCFIPKRKNSIRLKIARKNITCYKIVYKSKTSDDTLISHIYNQEYIIGGLYKTHIGIHRPNATEQNVVVESGFHSYRRKPNPKSIDYDEFIATCTIPKGSIYARNKYEYVSSHIIINKVISRFDYQIIYD